MKLNSYNFIKNWLPRGIVLATLVLIVLNLFFIYQNVWQVFAYSKKALSIQNEVVPAELKIDLFKKIEGRLDNKKIQEKISLDSLKNPFLLTTEKIKEPKLR